MSTAARGYRVGATGKRPWGSWRVLAVGEGYAVKRIDVAPERRLSLQRHFKRIERWTIVAGMGVVTLGARTRKIAAGDVVRVGPRTVHRLANTGKATLTLIEVQLGAELAESDIERLSDDYGRPTTL
jgi:mannose-6-phosphate isomerase-like protein (cupin superfamily)